MATLSYRPIVPKTGLMTGPSMGRRADEGLRPSKVPIGSAYHLPSPASGPTLKLLKKGGTYSLKEVRQSICHKFQTWDGEKQKQDEKQKQLL